MIGYTSIRDDSRDVVACTQRFRPDIEAALELHLPRAPGRSSRRLNEALRAAVFPGGRRIRAVLALLASELVGADRADALIAATAVEYLHSSAVILDDLPSMDDARERRGRPCLHRLYGEGLTLIVALSLVNTVFDLLARRVPYHPAGMQAVISCVAAQAYGQAADLDPAVPVAGNEVGSPCRLLKTSALVSLSLTLGPILAGTAKPRLAALTHFGELLGNAYQMLDDAEDVIEDSAMLMRGHAKTFAIEHGAEAARDRVTTLIEAAVHCLDEEFGRAPAAVCLHNLVLSLVADKITGAVRTRSSTPDPAKPGPIRCATQADRLPNHGIKNGLPCRHLV